MNEAKHHQLHCLLHRSGSQSRRCVTSHSIHIHFAVNGGTHHDGSKVITFNHHCGLFYYSAFVCCVICKIFWNTTCVTLPHHGSLFLFIMCRAFCPWTATLARKEAGLLAPLHTTSKAPLMALVWSLSI